MELVIDANVLFAALIRRSGTSDLLFTHTLYAPEFLFSEFTTHQEEIQRKTNRNEQEFRMILELFERNIILVPQEELSPFLEQAAEISPDPADVPYFAVCLRQNCALWTNDKRLKRQSTVRVFLTDELMTIT